MTINNKKFKYLSFKDRKIIHHMRFIEKTQIGHFEVDLIFHKNNRSANISAMIDKASQKVILCFNRNKTSDTVSYGLLQIIKNIPKHIKKTMIFDDAREFANHINYHLKGFYLLL